MIWTDVDSLPAPQRAIIAAFAPFEGTAIAIGGGEPGKTRFGAVITIPNGAGEIHLWSVHRPHGGVMYEGWHADREVALGKAEGSLSSVPGGALP